MCKSGEPLPQALLDHMPLDLVCAGKLDYMKASEIAADLLMTMHWERHPPALMVHLSNLQHIDPRRVKARGLVWQMHLSHGTPKTCVALQVLRLKGNNATT